MKEMTKTTEYGELETVTMKYLEILTKMYHDHLIDYDFFVIHAVAKIDYLSKLGIGENQYSRII